MTTTETTFSVGDKVAVKTNVADRSLRGLYGEITYIGISKDGIKYELTSSLKNRRLFFRAGELELMPDTIEVSLTLDERAALRTILHNHMYGQKYEDIRNHLESVYCKTPTDVYRPN